MLNFGVQRSLVPPYVWNRLFGEGSVEIFAHRVSLCCRYVETAKLSMDELNFLKLCSEVYIIIYCTVLYINILKICISMCICMYIYIYIFL